MADIEIKSSLLNDEDFKFVKNSLINISKIDQEDKFRVKMVEYINDSCYNGDDMFFYDMLIFLRFLNPNDDAVAYTTPNKEIFMNCPGHKDIGKSVRQWEFVYDHECLHQLWDTFAVGDKIKKEKGSCDHYILNIASDCVINDYLLYYRKKERPSFGIFPDNLKKDTGVEYDRKVDTQYSLYLKLLEVQEKLKNNKDYQDAQSQSGEGQGQSDQGQQGQSQGSGSGSGNGGQNNNQESKANNASDAQEQAKQAQDAANRAKKAAEKAEANGDEDYDEKKELADKAQQAADKAKEAAEKAKEAAENKDKEGEKKAAKEAQEAADEAKKAADEAEGNKNNDKSSKEGDKKDNKDSQEGSGKGHGEGHEDVTETSAELEKIREQAKDIIDKYKNKISGVFGDFIKKCKVSKDLKDTGLAVNTKSGSNGWNEKMNSYVNTFVKKKVFQKKRQYQETYSRIRRGSGFVEYGKPIKPGKKVKEEKLNINVAFYIDRSGSMSNCINQVFKACYVISEALKKKFKKESVVDKIEFKIYAFDDSMVEIKYGNQCDARGGTMGFHQILEFMNKNTENFLINIIITDAEFSINESEVKKFMKDIKGMLLFITNNDNATMKKLSKEYETQLFYILADSNFEIK